MITVNTFKNNHAEEFKLKDTDGDTLLLRASGKPGQMYLKLGRANSGDLVSIYIEQDEAAIMGDILTHWARQP